MPLYEDLARQILNKKSDELMALPEGARRQEIENLFTRLESNPALTIDAEVPQDIVDEINEGEVLYSKYLRHFNDMSKNVTPEHKERYTPKRWSGLKQLYRDSELVKMGVVLDRDLPAGDIELGFGIEPVRSLQGALKEHFNKKGFKGAVPVFKSGEDIIYIDPTDQKPVRVNPGWKALVGKGIPIATEVGATIAITKGRGAGTGTPGAMKMVAKETGASGVGAAVGELVKLSIGKYLDAHDLSDTEIWEKSGIHGATSAAITAGVGFLLAGTKGFIGARHQGRVFTEKDAIEAGIPAKNSELVVNELNKFLKARGKKSKFKPTLAQKADDAILESSEAQLRRKVEYSQRFKDADVLNAQAEKDTLDLMTQPSVKPYAPSSVSEVAGRRAAHRVEQAKDIFSKNTDEFNQQLNQIGKISKEQVGESTLKVLRAKNKLANDALNSQWDSVRKLGGFDPKTELYNISIPNGSETKNLQAIFKRQAETARTTLGSPPSDVFVTAAKKAGKKAIPIERKLEDLSDFNIEIGRLKKKYRQISDNGVSTDIDTRDLQKVINALEADRKIALYKAGRTDLMKAIDAAENQTAKYHEVYKRSVIGDLTQVNKNGVPEIKSQEFVDNMLKRDPSEVDDFLAVISDNPELINQWKQGIANAYKRTAFRGTTKKGVKNFNRDASDNFLAKNAKALDKFFNKKELEGFRQTGKLSEKVNSQVKKLSDFKHKAQDLWGSGKLSRIDPDSLVEFVTDSEGSWITAKGQGVQNTIKKIKFVKNITKEYPGAWQRFQNDFTAQLKKRLVTDHRTGRINPNNLASWIEDTGKSDTIKQVMGKQYYDDLVTVNKMIRMLNKPMDKLAANEAAKGWVQTIRAGAAPPLTARGRALTAILTFGSNEGHKRTADALLDQNLMRQTAELAEHSAWTRQFFEKAASIGYILDEE